MLRHFKRHPSPAMAVAFVALLAALSGSAIALPGKNTVDSGDLKKNAVKTSDIAKNAVTGKKVKNNTVKGADVLESSLGIVPSANNANNATNATNANRANSAGTADLANSVAPSEGYHEVGTSGNPSFGAGCTNAVPSGAPDVFERVAFYKDLEGVVHLRGVVECDPTFTSSATNFPFQLPPGYRPRNGKLQVFPNALCDSCSNGSPLFFIAGAAIPPIGPTVIPDGAVAVGDGVTAFDGTSFRAEG